jgi:hypothetical protein
MANPIRFKYGTEAQILALTPADSKWVDQAFYYPNDKDYFYQAFQGVMRIYGSGSGAGVGIKLNGKVMGTVKRVIREGEVLDIPTDYDYNTYTLRISGIVDCRGQINIKN